MTAGTEIAGLLIPIATGTFVAIASQLISAIQSYAENRQLHKSIANLDVTSVISTIIQAVNNKESGKKDEMTQDTTGPAHYRQGGICQKTLLVSVMFDSRNPIIKGELYPEGSETSIVKQLWEDKPYPDNTWHYAKDCDEIAT